MGLQDDVSKEYISDRFRFADLFNNAVFGGERMVDPERLHEQDSVQTMVMYGGGRMRGGGKRNKDFMSTHRVRDVLKKAVIMNDGKLAYLLLGIENQTDINLAEPVRCMLYDAMKYADQVRDIAGRNRNERGAEAADGKAGDRDKGKFRKDDGYEFLSGLKASDRLHPVITLVVYWGVDEWTGPRKLSDMLGYVPDKARHAVADYEINLLEPCKLKDFSGFRTGLGSVLRLLSVGSDKEEIKRLCDEQKDTYENLGREDAEMLEVFMNKRFIRDEGEEETVNVFKGIQDWMDEKKEEGRAEGREEGRIEGREEGRAEGREEGRAEGREEGLAEGREKGRAEGREEGLAEGREEGRVEGHDEFAGMIRYLVRNGRNEDVMRATEDKSFRKQLFAEYASLAPAN